MNWHQLVILCERQQWGTGSQRLHLKYFIVSVLHNHSTAQDIVLGVSKFSLLLSRLTGGGFMY